MKKKVLSITMAVLFLGTAIFTMFIFFPTLFQVKVVNTDEIVVLEQEEVVEESKYKQIEEGLNISTPYSSIVDFEITNRELPTNWKEKEIYFRYSYLGEYSNTTYKELTELLTTDYNWRNQLTKDEDILLGGPMILKDNIYQLHVHNGLSLAKKYYLFGDLLHYLYSKELLKGTRIVLNNVKIECEWVKEIYVEENNVIPGGVDLVMSTCLERRGDHRLVSGWKVVIE